MRLIRWLLSMLRRENKRRATTILVDREGVAYLPTRRVILRGVRQ